jgi:hypothetical protein
MADNEKAPESDPSLQPSQALPAQPPDPSSQSPVQANQQPIPAEQPGAFDPSSQPAGTEPLSSSFASTDSEPLSDNTGGDSITWTASEYISHEKSTGWYALLALATAAIASALYLITKDFVSVGVAVISGTILGISAARKPRELPYRVDTHGISIDSKQYAYGNFRSFAIMPEGAFTSIVLVPLKRFSPLLTIYYAPEDEEKIVSLISAELPNEERKYDAVDHLMRRIRF